MFNFRAYFYPLQAQRSPDSRSLLVAIVGGQVIGTASDDHTWKLWSSPSGELVMSGEGHKDWVRESSMRLSCVRSFLL